ncbi:copper chaperone [Neobacillus notoginsengisoli]|uniref:Copper chaperone CopZ n=1 Tax=Neobacillus notoginsengisoli TaxID=1578198 RepID=A0A417YSG9_9BACI|nr:copper chaperone CopZ [Neobacillus notoginsengisoli]RHW38886.1 copper chaperone [Neobacillus notoginsengisoli]
MEKALLNVEGMSCGHCVKAVEGSVGKLDGVERVLVDLKEKTVAVEYKNDSVTLDKIKETIEDQGYDIV